MNRTTGHRGPAIPVSGQCRRPAPWRHRVTMALMLIPLTAFGFGPGPSPATRHIHPGDEVVLHRSIGAASGARVYLQHGRVVAGSPLKHRQPYCYFHVYRDPAVIDTGFTIHPDRFAVKATGSRIEFSGAPLPNVRYAMSSMDWHDYSAEYMITTIRLGSASQPLVRELKCGIFAVPFERGYISLEEIRQALGNLVVLESGRP